MNRLINESVSLNKNITIINQDSGYLMIDIANAFVEAGYHVSLISGRLVQRNIPLNEKIIFEKIVRYNRTSIPSRVFTWMLGIFQILFKIWFKYDKSELFIVSNPPLAPLIPLVCKNKFSLLIFDVYVEKPSELPVLKNLPFLFKLWVKAHQKVFSKAERIFTLTEGMKENISKYTGNKLVEIVPIWTDNEFLKPIPAENNPFVKQHNLENKFIVLYSGNIGASSGVEILVDVAAEIKSDLIQFVIIGEGLRKSNIVEKVNQLKLTNCLILTWQEADVLPFSLASANLAVIGLVGESSKRSIPSKLYNFFSVGAPILSITDLESDLARLIQKQNVGACFPPNAIQNIAEFIIRIAVNPDQCLVYSRNSLITSKEYTIKNVQTFLQTNV